MQIGVVFPQTEIEADAGAVRAYAEAAEGLGFRHLVAYDHVLGADPAVHRGWDAPYDLHDPFHEPLVLFGYLAGLCRLELATGILIAPQRQTALVAKQAAEVDNLTGGRLRLGVGLGWNKVEYDALGPSFATRGRRLEEQVGLLRRLWTEESVTFSGEFDRVEGAGLRPLPVQRPIPVWMGAAAPAALRRAGRLADGWFPMALPGPGLDQAMAHVAEGAREAGRSGSVPFEGRLEWSAGAERLADHAERWRAAGAWGVSLTTMRAGCAGVDAHVAALTTAAQALGLQP